MCGISSAVLAAALLLALFAAPAPAAEPNPRQPFAIVHPVADHTKLELDEEGLAMLQRVPGPVAPVVVIGPYRSGKSFLLNQMLRVKCDEGFGVGHTRVTQTKGVWMWGEPTAVDLGGGRKVNLIFFDTEGFESTGKADVYDDRIFALSALISQVLVYNLPEAIRESDLEKLSFAVELSKAFYDDSQEGQQGAAAAAAAKDPNALPIRPGHMIWLIQRDFLQGKALDTTLAEALQPVPNPHNDAGISQLNRIRSSLGNLARNSSALGLPQPHLDRTKLCELGDEALAPEYVAKREALRELVRSVAQPKVVQGAELDGAGLAALVRRVVAALNQREIPTAGSLIEFFNRELVAACRAQYAASLERVALPVNASELAAAAEVAQQAALDRFERQRFGTAVEDLRQALRAAMEKELAARMALNQAESGRVCEKAELACEEVLEREARQRLPSVGRFHAQFEKCSRKFRQACVGPGLESNQERLSRAWKREEARFASEYNARLLNGLVMISLAAIVVFRFFIKIYAAETLGWAAFIFLQVWPKTFLGEGSMYDAAWWKWLVWAWEAAVYNPLVDLEGWGLPLGVLALAAYMGRRWYWARLRGWWAGRRPRSAGGGGGGWWARLWRRRPSHSQTKAQLDRDLDV